MRTELLLLAAGLWVPALLHAADSADPGDSGTGTEAGATPMQRADSYQREISENINSAAQWVDSFFDDERYIAEDATTKLRVGQAVFQEYGDTPEFKTRVNLSFDVPHTEKRLRLFVGRDEVEDARDNRQNIINDNTGDGSAAGVQFFAKASDRQNLSLTAGVKVSSADLFAGPRYRYTFQYHDWQLRFTQGFRWYTGTGWESRTRFDYERIVYEKLFFRQTLEGRWREEDPGYEYSLRSTLTQPIKSRKAIEYQLAFQFKTHPQQRLDNTVLRIRYRQNFLRKWLFYEMNPQIAMRNDEHFKPKPGIELRIEVLFGGRNSLKPTDTQAGAAGDG